MKVYLIPGLGFDNRIFRNLTIEHHKVVYINWIDSLKNESIQSYAKRLAKDIDSNSVLIGHSFGGIICQEISTFIPVKKIILISCIKRNNENPFHFRIMKPTGLYKLFSKKLTAITIKFWGTNYDYFTKEEKKLVKSMVNKQTSNYLQWALKQLSIWKKPKDSLNDNIIKIHGELDKTFPINLLKKPSYVVKDGGHFMVYKKPEIIEEIIYREINSLW